MLTVAGDAFACQPARPGAVCHGLPLHPHGDGLHERLDALCGLPLLFPPFLPLA